MNLLIIEEISFAGKPATNIESIMKYLSDRLAAVHIGCQPKSYKNKIEFHPNAQKKLFHSLKKNKIPLEKNDPRVAKNGRDYLHSERFTETQYNELVKTFSTYLDQIHVSCSVKLFSDKNDPNKFVELRDVSCNNNINLWDKPKTFTVEA